MKKLEVKGQMMKYHNPLFKEVVMKTTLNGKEEERNVTFCLAEVIDNTGFITLTGVAIQDPEDKKNSDLGKTIAEGRALKSPIIELMMVSESRLPRAMCNELLVWAERFVERKLKTYITMSRGTLK